MGQKSCHTQLCKGRQYRKLHVHLGCAFRIILIGLNGLTKEQVAKVVIAYEPVWAIGTGLTATDEQANETIGVIRKAIARKYGKAVGNKVRIQYGGSMNPKNVKGLMAQPEIDGGLIGGASLKAPDFSQVVNYDK